MKELTESLNRNLMASRVEEEQSDNGRRRRKFVGISSRMAAVKWGRLNRTPRVVVLNWAPTYNL